jgi:flagella basal body P-ring formation protein FlgA
MNKSPLICFLPVSLLFTALVTSAVMAASWNPEDTLRRFVKDNYPWPEIEIKDLVLNGTAPVKPPDKIIVEKRPPGRAVFTMEFDGGRKITADATIKAFDRVILSRGAFRKGYYFRNGDAYPSLMDVRRIPGGAIKDIDRIVGKPLTRSVIANMPLTSAMVSETPIVKRGQKVTLLVESEGLRITASGVMKQNGSVGSYVKALNIGCKKTVTGLLVDENTVKVE